MRAFLSTLTGKIIVANCIIALISVLLGAFGIFDPFTAWFPMSVQGLMSGHIWEPFTYMWVHASLAGPGMLHLFFNMLALYLFGQVIEREMGPRGFLYLYLPGGLVAAAFFLISYFFRNEILGENLSPMVGVIGASGAVLAIAAAFATLHPNIRLFIIPIPFPIKAKWAIAGFVIFSGVCLLMGWLPFVAHSAHIGGALWGYFLMSRVRRSVMRRPSWQEEYVPFDEMVDDDMPQDVPPGKMDVEKMSEARLKAELDLVLDKISSQGMHSLNDRERQILERARSMFS